ncbi:unnamed protein product [Brachionus calyciflorus]|uniref:Uncharacterized protein n=1 Tax=Brachionus calyciflorus TaxID=104777 RepID=A0A814Q3L6_9BILA|nr:unnamed protein product [Brachionus calyciflorus]
MVRINTLFPIFPYPLEIVENIEKTTSFSELKDVFKKISHHATKEEFDLVYQKIIDDIEILRLLVLKLVCTKTNSFY